MTRLYALCAVLFWSLAAATATAAAGGATDWVEGNNARSRLLFGGRIGAGGRLERYAALEIELAPGWKTYWRQPGSAGGIPPSVDVSGSQNIAAAHLSFPAPHRYTDPSGDTIGYKGRVVFPVRLEFAGQADTATLDFKVFFGVCREICIPSEAAFNVSLDPARFRQWPPQLARAVARVPVAADAAVAENLPRITHLASNKAADGKHEVVFDVRYAGGTAGSDVFAETTDGMGLDMTQVAATPAPDTIRYRLPVDAGTEWAKIRKNGIILTIVSDAGSRRLHVNMQ